MCGCFGELLHRAMPRRSLLVATAAGLTVAQAARAAEEVSADTQAAEQRRVLTEAAKSARSKLVLLGTAGGPTYWPGSNRSSTSSLLVVGDVAYMVDCGSGAARRLQQALQRPPSPERRGSTDAFRALRAMFLTHLHSDHTVDIPALLLYGYYAGLDLPGRSALQVYGPGRRGQVEPVFAPSGKTPIDVPLFNAMNSSPGTREMVSLLMQAYATDVNDRMRDNAKRAPDQLVQAHDIVLPDLAGFRNPNMTPTPNMEPFSVYQDDKVKVSAILVAHAPIWPAFAYRFDTADGAVVFSGDTGPCGNLIKLAQGADILVHEVIVTSWVDTAFPEPRTDAQNALRAHLLAAHTPVEEVGKIAQAAGVGTLVLNHLVPGHASAADLLPAKAGFDGVVVIGDDLLEIGLKKRA